jgi:hypothetical protein
MSKLWCFGFILILAAGLAGCSDPRPGYVFPDPCLSGSTEIVFTDLPASCTIEVYTLSGERVKTLVESDGDGQAIWDIRNDAGELLGSGLYTYIIRSDQEEQGKIVITR